MTHTTHLGRPETDFADWMADVMWFGETRARLLSESNESEVKVPSLEASCYQPGSWRCCSAIGGDGVSRAESVDWSWFVWFVFLIHGPCFQVGQVLERAANSFVETDHSGMSVLGKMWKSNNGLNGQWFWGVLMASSCCSGCSIPKLPCSVQVWLRWVTGRSLSIGLWSGQRVPSESFLASQRATRCEVQFPYSVFQSSWKWVYKLFPLQGALLQWWCYTPVCRNSYEPARQVQSIVWSLSSSEFQSNRVTARQATQSRTNPSAKSESDLSNISLKRANNLPPWHR